MADVITVQATEPANILLDPVTKEVPQLFRIANYVIISGIFSIFGIGSNIVVICVFVKQGFKDSINISLMALAVSDLACSAIMFWLSVTFSPWLHDLDLPMETLEVSYVTGAVPHTCFFRITSFITAFITLERCLCIAMPLNVKVIITPFRTKVINAAIFASMFFLFSPFYFVHSLAWRHDAHRNRSTLGLAFGPNRVLVDTISFFINSVFLSLLLLLVVIVCTVILVMRLNQKSQWRAKSAQTNVVQNTGSVKETKVVKMVTLISVMFIVCYTPPTLIVFVMAFNPDFSITGRYHRLLYSIWSVVYIFEALNSSLNLFVYFTMSSKFKHTLTEMFCVHFSRKKISHFVHFSRKLM